VRLLLPPFAGRALGVVSIPTGLADRSIGLARFFFLATSCWSIVRPMFAGRIGRAPAVLSTGAVARRLLRGGRRGLPARLATRFGPAFRLGRFAAAIARGVALLRMFACLDPIAIRRIVACRVATGGRPLPFRRLTTVAARRIGRIGRRRLRSV